MDGSRVHASRSGQESRVRLDIAAELLARQDGVVSRQQLLSSAPSGTTSSGGCGGAT
jgi:hypothetical protein